MPKTFASTYLYTKYPEYEKEIFNFLMTAEQVNKEDESFYDIKYEVKRRQISNSLIKVLESKNVILLIPNKPLPKSFKVFVAKDVKGDRHLKTFIDCSGVIYKDNGKYKSDNPDILIAHLISAMNALIYQVTETKITGSNSIAEDGARCFSSLFTHIIDYISKISVMGNNKDKCLYLSSMYYLTNILGKDDESDSVKAIAKRISGLSDRELDIIRIQLKEETFGNIKYFVEGLADILKLSNITLDIVLEKWMYLYGPGTAFSLELYPSFSTMITDAYVGCYLNNQKTIEKIAGRSMVDFTKTVLRIGDDAV